MTLIRFEPQQLVMIRKLAKSGVALDFMAEQCEVPLWFIEAILRADMEGYAKYRGLIYNSDNPDDMEGWKIESPHYITDEVDPLEPEESAAQRMKAILNPKIRGTVKAQIRRKLAAGTPVDILAMNYGMSQDQIREIGQIPSRSI